MSKINFTERLLNSELKSKATYILRQHEPGDMGWVTYLHGALYAREYGWDERFEALVAQIVSDFITHYNPDKERCWIAEMDGQVVGSVFVVQGSETEAKLRLLLVDEKARGLGLGTRLVEECIRFARRQGYKKLVFRRDLGIITVIALNVLRRACRKASPFYMEAVPCTILQLIACINLHNWRSKGGNDASWI